MDSVADVLRIISDNFEAMGGRGRMGISFDCPVKISLPDRTHRTTIKLIWTEDGLRISNPEEQARRIAREIEANEDGTHDDPADQRTVD